MQGGTFAALASFLAISLNGCMSSESIPSPCHNTSYQAPSAQDVKVYFGCGCFWHMQHEFVVLEITNLCRQDGNLSARAAYAGGTQTGEKGRVCYHNTENTADYGALGHAEVVSLSVPEAKFGVFAAKYWEACRSGRRQDTQDIGGEYRSVVGLPGGMDSPFLGQLQQNAGTVELVAGKGNDGDTLSTGKVYVYDSIAFPAYTAEKYHQFHDDMMDSYGGTYNSLQKWAKKTSCPGDETWTILQ
eukprot:TRINITY_DN6953_c0_g4_i1.p1 TRINITY_DN6953_c0_g4~~TRINITY_DN6953_c0_g4_i1.p1  ORF type:complete len:244 (-),score=24.39 TRINITY_DN6953_c0_g4_i1:569-1300(-)